MRGLCDTECTMLKTILYIGCGSFIGGVMRFLLSRYVQSGIAGAFPWGTLSVNLIGCLLMGLLYGIMERGNIGDEDLRLFLTVGVCGGFTTFSTFAMDGFMLLKWESLLPLLGYLAVSVVGGILLFFLGYTLIRQF